MNKSGSGQNLCSWILSFAKDARQKDSAEQIKMTMPCTKKS